ncbi:MAG TPA: hypothetical protein PK385_11790 [Spirochaetota bacterium]|nr:hypothetical protein [Spirochaetota bacterium]HOS31845.1 hypothetical protein [Spirochaetota bacterium]HOS56724.1 hypothetical protein [Spirochaetota bacterium]HPK61718.1 hypothetical protein [Spirochaetota bacterium]HQF76689.1 hypothetical protein [Spirochaetota bacterium]
MNRFVCVCLYIIFFLSLAYSEESAPDGKFLFLGIKYITEEDDTGDKILGGNSVIQNVVDEIRFITSCPTAFINDILQNSANAYKLSYKEGFLKNLKNLKIPRSTDTSFLIKTLKENCDFVENYDFINSSDNNKSFYNKDFLDYIKNYFDIHINDDYLSKLNNPGYNPFINEKSALDLLDNAYLKLKDGFGLPFESYEDLYKLMGIAATISLQINKEIKYFIGEEEELKKEIGNINKIKEYSEKDISKVNEEISEIILQKNKLKESTDNSINQVYNSFTFNAFIGKFDNTDDKSFVRNCFLFDSKKKTNIVNEEKRGALFNFLIDKTDYAKKENEQKLRENYLALISKYPETPETYNKQTFEEMLKYAKDINKNFDLFESKNSYLLKKNYSLTSEDREILRTAMNKVNYKYEKSIYKSKSEIDKNSGKKQIKIIDYKLSINYYSILLDKEIKRNFSSYEDIPYNTLDNLISDIGRRINEYIYNGIKSYNSSNIKKSVKSMIYRQSITEGKNIPAWIGGLSIFPGYGIGLFGLLSYRYDIERGAGVEINPKVMFSFGVTSLASSLTADIIMLVGIASFFPNGKYFYNDKAAIILAASIPFRALSFILNIYSFSIYINVKSLTNLKIYNELIDKETVNFKKSNGNLINNISFDLSLGIKL